MSVHDAAMAEAPKRVTIRDFATRKRDGGRLVVVTAYDALFGRLVDESGVDAILVGDSLANVVLGLTSTVPVTMEQMIHHAAATRRGVTRALLVVDMPFLSYQVSAEDALRNCGRMAKETECEAVKLEGGDSETAATVRAVVRAGIAVMGHLGFTPQSVNRLGGARVQARDADSASRLVDDARRLEDAGAFAIVLELVRAEAAARVTEAVSVPTIGIGAGARCDGQVLVLQDLLGLNDGFAPRFLKRYASLGTDVRDAVRHFGDEVRAGTYPDDAHSF